MSDKLDRVLARIHELEAAVSGRLDVVEAAIGISPPSRPVDDDEPAPENSLHLALSAPIRYGLTRVPPPKDDYHLPTRLVAARYGVSLRCIERWVANPALNFPKPIFVNRRKFWFQAELARWDRERARAETPRQNTTFRKLRATP